MRLDPRRAICWLAVWTLCLYSVGCSTLRYRDIQERFEEAVRADNRAGTNPFADRSAQLYDDVLDALREEEIETLDAELQANAWMLRSYAQWRRGRLADARDSAAEGIRRGQPIPSSRDDVLLHLMPALVADSATMARWRGGGGETRAASYLAHQADFELALAKLARASERVGTPTPDSVIYYLAYQHWRILQNWRTVIDAIEDDDSRRRARDAAKQQVAGDLRSAAEIQRDAIPSTHPLHRLILASGG